MTKKCDICECPDDDHYDWCSAGISSRSSKDQLYYLQVRGYCGNSVLWWRKGRCGYTSDIQAAHVFTKDEAFGQQRCRPDEDFPWRKDYIDSILQSHVHCEHLDRDAEAAFVATHEPPASLWGDGTREMLIQLRDWLKSKMPCPAGDCCNELRTWIEKVDKEISFHAPAASAPPPPADQLPSAWIKGHTMHTDAGLEYDEEVVPGSDSPPGDGWHPLYSRPAECPACPEFVRMQHDIASILGVDDDTDSISLHGRIYGALSMRAAQPPGLRQIGVKHKGVDGRTEFIWWETPEEGSPIYAGSVPTKEVK